MTNEVFAFPRFWNYLKYDLKQTLRFNIKGAVMIGGFSLIFYVLAVGLGVLFNHTWSAPGIESRAIMFVVGIIALILYQTRTYGYLTDKRKGSSWLMIPASVTEKFVSMMLITLIVLPLAYTISYLLIDALIALLDPTAGQAVIGGASYLLDELREGLIEVEEQGLSFNLSAFVLPVIFEFFTSLLYFLLCGIYFRKWKLGGAIAVLLSFQFVMTMVVGLTVQHWSVVFDLNTNDPVMIADRLNNIITAGSWLNVITTLVLGTLVFLRLKSLKH